jgi:5'-deoxynucleotidase YfbR-like HD superfamily hydrolase
MADTSDPLISCTSGMDDNAASRMNDTLALSHVPRWCIVPHFRPQSVADHTFRVLVIVRELAHMVGVPLTMDDFLAILTHDSAESKSGDISSPFKRALLRSDRDTSVAGAITTAELEACDWLNYEPVMEYASTGPVPRAGDVFKAADLIEAYTFISTYGVGRHAAFVADNMMTNAIMEIHPPTLQTAALTAIRNINSDRGRLWDGQVVARVTTGRGRRS